MSENNKILTLILLLLVVLVMILGVYSYNQNNSSSSIRNNFDTINSTNSYIQINTIVEKPTNKVLINDKFTGKLNKDGNLLVASEDGSIYNIKKGVVLVDGNIVEVSKEESSFIVLKNRD